MNSTSLFNLYSVQFDYAGADAIPMKDVRSNEFLTGQEKDRPEWIKGLRAEPAAYVKGTKPKVQVVFLLGQGECGEYWVGATGTSFNIEARKVNLEYEDPVRKGMVGPVEFEFDTKLPEQVGINSITLNWYFKSSKESPKRMSLGTTAHTICATFKHLEAVAELDEKWVYKPVMLWTSEWASGRTDEKAICDAIISNLYKSGLQYGIHGWEVRYMLLQGGGMCSGFYQLFQQMAYSQGVFIEKRWFGVYWQTPYQGNSNQVGWNAITADDGGLNQLTSTSSPGYYHDNDDKFPSEKARINKPAALRRYCFYGKENEEYDGHCINFLEYDHKVYLYDPSFGKGPFEIPFQGGVIPPINESTSLLLTGENLTAFKEGYLNKCIPHMLGSLYNGPAADDDWYSSRIYNDKGEELIIPRNGMTVKTSLIPSSAEYITFYWNLVPGWRRKPDNEYVPFTATVSPGEKKPHISILAKLIADKGKGSLHDWGEIYRAIDILDHNDVDLLTQLLKEKIKLHLAPHSQIPHSLSPTDMVKTLVLQKLRRIYATHQTIANLKAVNIQQKNDELSDAAASTVESPVLKQLLKTKFKSNSQ